MENKCPVCKAGTLEDWNRKVRQCDSCGFQCDTEDLPRIAAAMDAERRMVELQGAVLWERECDTVWWQIMRDNTNLVAIREINRTQFAARAAVDALVGEGCNTTTRHSGQKSCSFSASHGASYGSSVATTIPQG